jgi:hypothetical protein
VLLDHGHDPRLTKVARRLPRQALVLVEQMIDARRIAGT